MTATAKSHLPSEREQGLATLSTWPFGAVTLVSFARLSHQVRAAVFLGCSPQELGHFFPGPMLFLSPLASPQLEWEEDVTLVLWPFYNFRALELKVLALGFLCPTQGTAWPWLSCVGLAGSQVANDEHDTKPISCRSSSQSFEVAEPPLATER